jgi:hypothetical protein
MRTLTAQHLKKQAEKEYKERTELIERIFEEATAEMEKLATLLTIPADTFPREEIKVEVEEYREDDEVSYFEQGFIEL